MAAVADLNESKEEDEGEGFFIPGGVTLGEDNESRRRALAALFTESGVILEKLLPGEF